MIKDVTGQKFGRLTAIKHVGFAYLINGNRRSVWLWSCDCGTEKELPLNQVSTGNTKSCGCLFSSIERGKNITGQRFGYLTAIKRVERVGEKKQQKWVWELVCDCGGKTKSVLNNLTSGNRKTCGCRMSNRGINSYNWNGGKQKKAGYVYLYLPNHPTVSNKVNNKCYVAEHRVVMEKILGRYLLSTEEVHHKNAIRDDNRPENLELWVRGRQPRGARATDLVKFAREILTQYGHLFPEK